MSKAIWVLEVKEDKGKWYPSTWNVMGTSERACLLQFKNTFSDRKMFEGYRFRKYVPAKRKGVKL